MTCFAGRTSVNEWTEDHWENLLQLASWLDELLRSRDLKNPAWRAKLRITLNAIADYRECL